jgi:hypothetical protein
VVGQVINVVAPVQQATLTSIHQTDGTVGDLNSFKSTGDGGFGSFSSHVAFLQRQILERANFGNSRRNSSIDVIGLGASQWKNDFGV